MPEATAARISAFFHAKAPWFGLVMVFGLPWSHAFFNIGLVGLLACVLAAPSRYKDLVTACREPVALLAVLLFACIAIGLAYTAAPAELAVHDIGKYRKLLLIPILLMVYRDMAWARKLVIAYACGVVILLIPTVLDGTGMLRLLSLDLSKYRNASYDAESLVYWRNHIVHGFHASVLFVICVVSAIHHRKLAWPCSAVAAVCLLDIAFFIHGRAALLGLLAACFLLALSTISRWLLRVGLVVAILAASVLAYEFSESISARVDSISQQARAYAAERNVATSGGMRLHYWHMSLEMFAQAPLVGTGPGTFRQNLLQPGNPLRGESHWHAHSEYLTLLSQHGLVGLMLFLLLVQQIYQNAGRSRDPWLAGIARLGLAIFLINAVTDSLLHNQSEGWTLVLLACLAAMRPSDARAA